MMTKKIQCNMQKKTEQKNFIIKKQWRQLTSEQVYENSWISVSHDTVITPGGSQGIYGCVHFKNHAVGILAIDKLGWTWLVQQTRYPHGVMTWEIPEGGSPADESCLNSAKRELLEEVGLEATIWSEWLQLQLSNSVTDEVATIYLAQDLSQNHTRHEDTEDISVKHLPLKKAVQMVHSGEIVDAMSVASLLKAACDKRFMNFLED
jgi:8-oxo-dGTP pyrophosphatase MutT (NUDIX family)